MMDSSLYSQLLHIPFHHLPPSPLSSASFVTRPLPSFFQLLSLSSTSLTPFSLHLLFFISHSSSSFLLHLHLPPAPSSSLLFPQSLLPLPSLPPSLSPPSLPPFLSFLLPSSTGILQGVSSLLLVFDQAEVRKIVKHCEGIIEYVKVAEVVQTMEELVTFTKNLSPGVCVCV